MKSFSPMKLVVWGLVVILLIAHQDVWFWDKKMLEVGFGFIPIGLLYHAGISLAAGFTWFLATQFAWPDELDLEKYEDDAVEEKPAQESKA